MSTIIRRSETSASGFELVDNGVVMAVEKCTHPKYPHTLVLPTNSSNRKYFDERKVEAVGGEVELTYKETRTLGPRAESAPRKKIWEYLEGDERELLVMLLEKAEKAKEEANKRAPMTELEKAQRAVERAKERLAKLQAENEMN